MTEVNDSNHNGTVNIIEIGANINLGWKEIGEECQNIGVIAAYKDSLTITKPVGNPVLIDAGISQMTLMEMNGVTIFSKDGYSVRNCEWKISGCKNLVIRNLRIEGQREIDDMRDSVGGGLGTTKRSGWSNLKVSNTQGLWVDQCTFDYAFDGNIDIENATNAMSITWCQFGIEDESNESLLGKMVAYAEHIYQNNYKDALYLQNNERLWRFKQWRFRSNC